MTQEKMAEQGLKPHKAISIFSGVFEYSDEILHQLKEGLPQGFEPWKIHVNPQNIPDTDIINSFNNYYYESFINSIFPDFKRSDQQYFNPELASHTYRITKSMHKDIMLEIRNRGESLQIPVALDYIDIFFFPGNIAIYCFKCRLAGLSYNEITLTNNHIRNQGLSKDFAFLKDILRTFSSDFDAEAPGYGNKLKIFSLFEDGNALNKKEEENLLFDLGSCIPIGSASGNKQAFQPSEPYFNKLMDENRISVFENWSALCLNDTFTALFRTGGMNEYVWENAYFNLIYIHSLYVKNYLFRINKKFFLSGANKSQLEDEFYEFDKYFNIKQISFNFLPQIIYDKVRCGFDIDDELTQLQESISRANMKHKEKRDKKINDVLTIIALFTIFSIIWDLSEWLDKMFFNSPSSYKLVSGGLSLLFIFILAGFYLKNIREK